MLAAVLAFLAATQSATPPRPARPERPPAITLESGGSDRAFQRWESGQWQVLAGPDYCAADLEAGDMQFSVEQYWWTGRIQLQLMSRNWLSLRSRAGSRASVRITVDGGYSWASDEAIIAGSSEYGGFAMVLSGARAASVPTELARATVIDFVAEGRTLGAYQIEGAREAIEMLEACVTIMRSSDHRDPFASPSR